MSSRAPFSIALALWLSAIPAPAQQWIIEDPGQGPVPLAAGAVEAHELSGLAWMRAGEYAAVSDDGGRLFALRIDVDPASGVIAAARVDASAALTGSSDLEAVVSGPDGATVLVADEIGPAVREYPIGGGAALRAARLPEVFTTARHNLGFEALARDPAGDLWTANEEALAADGPTSSAGRGTWVRLLRLNAALEPTGQWAYLTDPIVGAAVLPDRGTGVTELVALPDGTLIALERSFGSEGLRIRLYELDRSGATEVSAAPNLSTAEVTPVRKRLLWEYRNPRHNFEGAALGPVLADGSRSLILISDDGHQLEQALYALRLRLRSQRAGERARS
ncbi:MAG: esterase-like activity of phytase family protein [Candidatus Binatia bacterium]